MVFVDEIGQLHLLHMDFIEIGRAIQANTYINK